MLRESLQTCLSALLATGMLLNCGCAADPGNPQAERAQDERKAMSAELEQKRQVRMQELGAMSVAELVAELHSEATRGVEPFNSMSFAEMVSRGETGASALKSELEGGERGSYLALLALRTLSPTDYDELDPALRTALLVDALASAETMNAWGLPNQYWEDAAKALIAEGSAASQALRPLLDDCRPAPLWGSEEVLASREYGYRLCDYAWALMLEIAGDQTEIPADPLERDRMLAKLKDPAREQD